MINLDAHYPSYTQFNPEVPVWCVTPHEGRVIHRFLILRLSAHRAGIWRFSACHLRIGIRYPENGGRLYGWIFRKEPKP